MKQKEDSSINFWSGLGLTLVFAFAIYIIVSVFKEPTCSNKFIYINYYDRGVKRVGCFPTGLNETDTTIYNDKKVILIQKINNNE